LTNIMRVLLFVAIIAVFILGYGYYHAATHAWLHVTLLDVSVKPYGGTVRNAELRFLDAGGKLLATGRSDEKFGVVRVIHPTAGDCSTAGSNASVSPHARERGQKCFQTLSTWVIDWAGEIRLADVKFAGCTLSPVPVTVHQTRQDWWLWWVPLPHIGGRPLTYFNISINVDGTRCSADGSRR
jgi:hypothetical protein